VALPLALIALLESIRFFLPVTRRAFRVLRTLSLVAGLHLLAAPFAGFLPGQDAFLVTSALGGLFILALVLRHRHHLYGPYLILSVLAILAGATLTALRTIGLLPVNGLTDSAFFLGAASGSLVLTSGVGRLLLQERKRRLVSDRQVRQEQQLRARIEREYDRLLKTHRVTGKPNRPMLEEALDNLDSQATPYTLCIVRLTRFAELEQTLGYRTSEQVLRQYLSKMNGFLKRALGDRLVMINGYALATIDTSHHAFAFYRHGDDDPALLETVAGWLGQRYQEGRFAFSWGPTLGVAHAPEHGRDAASILASAGFAALDRQGPITVYDPAIAEWQTRQQTLMLGLEQALASGDMSLAYQPKVRIEDRRVMSVEALIRWRHREFGTLSPEQWIPLAEEVGLIHPVTLWVLARACHDYPRLQQQHGPELRVSVNISAKDLALPQFPGELLDITRRHRLDRIILEITETAVMNDPESARSTLRQLGQAGFGIALDDFGIGHSSLSALATFDLDELKIDRSFLKDILDNPKRERILRMALGLGEALGVTVVVEGVEDAAVAGWLSQFPGLHGQGYYWGRPSPLPPDGGQRTPPD
jgi:EAL domain-containing protein (putative c-di-GMP-specific phosphodiesterase class I)/GGDEF domain-containing protein